MPSYEPQKGLFRVLKLRAVRGVAAGAKTRTRQETEREKEKEKEKEREREASEAFGLKAYFFFRAFVFW